MTGNSPNRYKGDILVVDDVPQNLLLLAAMLNRWGYKVRKATNGQMALTAAQLVIPDLILLDVNMPEMSGYEVCQYLKDNAQTRHIPIIFISAMDQATDKVRAFEVGGADYITKPFQIAEVIVRVENQLNLRRMQQQLEEQTRQLEAQNARLQQEIYDRQQAEIALQRANAELTRLVNLDGLTQLSSRRRFDELLQQEWRRLTREQSSLALILCDIDFFKLYNDTYGHQMGDDCLRQVAQTINQAARRPADVVARYGGEEFAVILPNTTAENAMYVAESIRREVQALGIPHANSPVHSVVTLSLGVSGVIPTEAIEPEQLIAVTDQALYTAKQQGRNRVILGYLDP